MSIKQYLSLFRANEWFHVLGLSFLGLIYASAGRLPLCTLLLCLAVSALYLAHGYAINEIFDSRSPGSKNKPGFIPALILAFSAFLFNLFFASLLAVQTVILVILGMLLSYLYSGYPLRLKEVPVVELVLNAAGFCLLFLIGYSAIKPLTPEASAIGSLFFILFFPLQLIHELGHLENDKEHRIHTTVAKFGIKKSVYFIVYSLVFLPLWAAVICRQAKIPFSLFLLSAVYSGILIRRAYSCLSTGNFSLTGNKLRIYARYLTVLYGAGIMLILSKSA
jgi:4-hydroxybenzoate polyprenyltransferase